jgi:hypothetical protein
MCEPEVVLPMRNLAGLWRELFPAEQCRLATLLIERVIVANGGLEIVWRDQGWQAATLHEPAVVPDESAADRLGAAAGCGGGVRSLIPQSSSLVITFVPLVILHAPTRVMTRARSVSRWLWVTMNRLASVMDL